MTDLNKSHVEILVDRSGSMSTIKTDTEGGLQTFIEEQRKVEGTCTVTLSEFDTTYDRVYTGVDVNETPRYTLTPRGMTALNDSLARSINELGDRLSALPEDKRPASVTVVVLTDGLENASVEFSGAAVKRLVERQQDKYSWNFIYLGANQDAVLTGKGLGFNPTQSLTYGGEHVGSAMRSASLSNAAYRSSTAAGFSYDKSIASSAFTDADRKEALTGSK